MVLERPCRYRKTDTETPIRKTVDMHAGQNEVKTRGYRREPLLTVLKVILNSVIHHTKRTM